MIPDRLLPKPPREKIEEGLITNLCINKACPEYQKRACELRYCPASLRYKPQPINTRNKHND